MNQQVALWALGAGLTVALFVIQQTLSKLTELRRENQLLRDTVGDQKLAILELKMTGHAVNRTLGAVQETFTPTEGGTP
jgi:hypothetical protein